MKRISRLCFTVIMLLIISYQFACKKSKNNSCSSDKDCPNGEICSAGSCITPSGCKKDDDCDNGYCLVETGKCVECLEDSQCPDDLVNHKDYICVNNQCVLSCKDNPDLCKENETCNMTTGHCGCKDDSACSSPTPYCLFGECVDCEQTGCPVDATCDQQTGECVSLCQSNLDCSEPTPYCKDGSCVSCTDIDINCSCGQYCNQQTGWCEQDPNFQGCCNDFDCQEGMVCENGTCVAGCDPNAPNACPDGYACNEVTGRCEIDQNTCATQEDCNPPDTVCVQNQCVLGCLTSGCPANQTCNQDTGLCGEDATQIETCTKQDTSCNNGTCLFKLKDDPDGICLTECDIFSDNTTCANGDVCALYYQADGSMTGGCSIPRNGAQEGQSCGGQYPDYTFCEKNLFCVQQQGQNTGTCVRYCNPADGGRPCPNQCQSLQGVDFGGCISQ